MSTGTRKVPAAVIGFGQTHHRAKREDVSIAGLLREAVDRALADAELTFADIDEAGVSALANEGVGDIREHYLIPGLVQQQPDKPAADVSGSEMNSLH